MPRIKSDQERGYIAAWMRRERIARGWSQKDMPDRLSTVGYPIKDDYYRQVEAGKKPGPDLLDALQRIFGSEPEPPAQQEAATPSVDMAALVAELRAQAAATRQLAAAVAQLAESVGHSHGLSHAAADGMTSTVLSAIENVRGILLERVPAPADTPPRHPVEQVPDPKA